MIATIIIAIILNMYVLLRIQDIVQGKKNIVNFANVTNNLANRKKVHCIY